MFIFFVNTKARRVVMELRVRTRPNEKKSHLPCSPFEDLIEKEEDGRLEGMRERERGGQFE